MPDLSHKITLAVRLAGVSPALNPPSSEPKAAMPAAGLRAPNPMRSIRLMPARSAIPEPAQAPQLTLTAATPCKQG